MHPAARLPLASALLLLACSGGDDPVASQQSPGAGQAGAAGGSAGGGVAGCPESVEAGTASEEDAPLSLAVGGTHLYRTNTASKKAGGAVRWVRLP